MPTSSTDPGWPGAFDIAGRRLRAELDAVAAPVVTAVLGHRAVEPGTYADDRLPSAGPPATWRAWASTAQHPDWVPGAAGPIRRSDGAVAMSRHHPPFLDRFTPDDDGGRLETWGSDAGWATGETAAHPGHLAIAAWLATTGAHVVHGAAVSVEGQGVLLVGAGGAGKSTTAIAMARAGAALLADDLCVIERDAGTAVVHPLYASCKLNADSDRRLALDTATLGRTAGSKRVIAMDGPLAPGAAVPVAAVVLLRPPGALDGAVRREPAGRAAAALGATGLLAALGAIDLADWFRGATALVRAVPAYSVELTWDLGRLTGAIAGVVGVQS